MSGFESAAEREIEVLEDEIQRLCDEGYSYDSPEVKEIEKEIRAIQREMSEYARWEEEGDERGWR